MKNYTITVNGQVYVVQVEEGITAAAQGAPVVTIPAAGSGTGIPVGGSRTGSSTGTGGSTRSSTGRRSRQHHGRIPDAGQDSERREKGR